MSYPFIGLGGGVRTLASPCIRLFNLIPLQNPLHTFLEITDNALTNFAGEYYHNALLLHIKVIFSLNRDFVFYFLIALFSDPAYTFDIFRNPVGAVFLPVLNNPSGKGGTDTGK